jgi:glycosyltransferase involved in cell wall biosynthesis
MESKKIRPVIVFAPNVLAGAEKVVITGTKALFELGLNPHLIVIQETRAPIHAENFIKEFPTDLKISVVQSRKALDFNLSREIEKCLEKCLKDEKNIVLHTHGFKALVTCRLIKGHVPQVHTHHGNTSHTFKVRVYEWLADLAMKRCEQVIAVSEEMKLLLLKNLSPYKKIVTVPNMLSFKNAEAIRNIRRSRVEKPLIQLIYIGRLGPEKGLVPFLHNLSKSDLNSKFSLTVLGDGPEMETAKKIASDQKLNVSFHGFVSNASDYLKTADVLILPSFTEGLPMTLIEALSSGVPVIANDVGAIKSLLRHQQNGYLTKSNDFSEWENAFNSAVANLKTWQSYTMDNAQAIEELHSSKRWAELTQLIYESVTL